MKSMGIFGLVLVLGIYMGVQASPVYDGTNPPPLSGTVYDYYPEIILGDYISGGTHSGYNPNPPSDAYVKPSPKGIAGAADELDWHWIQGFPIYDLHFPTNIVFMFPTGDHGPYPQDNVEAQVYGASSIDGPWVKASLTNVFRDGWVDYRNDGGASIEADDYASEWRFPNNAMYRYVKLDQRAYGPDGDMEVDAVGAPIPEPSSLGLFFLALFLLRVWVKKRK